MTLLLNQELVRTRESKSEKTDDMLKKQTLHIDAGDTSVDSVAERKNLSSLPDNPRANTLAVPPKPRKIAVLYFLQTLTHHEH